MTTTTMPQEPLWRSLAAPEEDDFYEGADTRIQHIRPVGKRLLASLLSRSTPFGRKTFRWPCAMAFEFEQMSFDLRALMRSKCLRWLHGALTASRGEVRLTEYHAILCTFLLLTDFFRLDMVPGRVGVPKDRLSGYEKFEAPDPAKWTALAGHSTRKAICCMCCLNLRAALRVTCKRQRRDTDCAVAMVARKKVRMGTT